jgi:hypothetical protein
LKSDLLADFNVRGYIGDLDMRVWHIGIAQAAEERDQDGWDVELHCGGESINVDGSRDAVNSANCSVDW